MPPRDHQAVPRRHRIGIGDAQRQFVLQQHPAAALQRAEHTTVLAMGVAGLQAAEVGGRIFVALAGIAAEAEGLQVAEVVRAAMVPGHDVVHLQGPLVLVCAAAFAAAFGPGEHPDFDRAADRGAVAAAVGEHLLAALHSEGIEALAAQLQQLFALGVAQFLPAHKVVGALVVAGDAVAGEHLADHPFHALRVVVDLGHVLPQDPAGYVLRRGGAAAAQELHEHQRLVDVAHAHAPRDVVAQALVGGGGGWGHGGSSLG